MANKIAIVTDSTAYIPEALNRQYNIHVVPQVLIWEQKTYRDGVDIKPAEFYQRQLHRRPPHHIASHGRGFQKDVRRCFKGSR